MTAERHYCTYFDSNYLAYGLTLYQSLRRHSPPFALHILCFDDLAYEYLDRARLDGVHPIRLRDLEEWDPALGAAKASRSRVEYYFTCTPDLVRYVMDRDGGIGDVTYLDADLYFFADPTPIFDEIGSGSVGIIAHRFPPEQTHREMFGIYNVGFLFFRNDPEGRRCLQWWRDRCLEWCYDRAEDGKFADQKYLDRWPALFDGVVVIQNPGAGLAPWNQARYPIGSSGGTVCAGGTPLIFYHFHELRLVFGVLSKHGLANYGGHMSPALKSKVYVPYIRELRRSRRRVRMRTGADIRYDRPGGAAQSARSIVNERVIILAGPMAVETTLSPVLKPLAWMYRVARKVIGST
jgi:hypothetical protein